MIRDTWISGLETKIEIYRRPSIFIIQVMATTPNNVMSPGSPSESCWDTSTLEAASDALPDAAFPSLGSPFPSSNQTQKLRGPNRRPTQRQKRLALETGATLGNVETQALIDECFSGSSVEKRRSQPGGRTQETSSRRQQALRELGDKEKTRARLTKTRMCRSVEKGGKCSHGDGCRYAHNTTELVTPTCLFDPDCFYVIYKEGTVLNKPGKSVCKQKHAAETKEQYLQRIENLQRRPPTPHPVCAQAPPAPRPSPTRTQVPTLIPRQVSLAASGKSLQPTSTAETILRVPLGLAEKALGAALNNGDRHIRIEII